MGRCDCGKLGGILGRDSERLYATLFTLKNLEPFTSKLGKREVKIKRKWLTGNGEKDTSGDLSGLPYPWTNLGFPALNSSDTPTCGRDGTQPACSRAGRWQSPLLFNLHSFSIFLFLANWLSLEFFTGFTKRAPAYAPFQTPVYSNAAFWILGYVIEGVTGRPYEEVVEQDIFRKLEMVHTSVKKPRDASLGVIPVGDSGWDYDIGGEGSYVH